MAAQTANDRTHNGSERPVSELVQQLSAQTGQLVRQELHLAQIELQAKGKRAGVGAGLFGGAGLVALYGVGFLLAAAALLIATALEPWIAVAIVGAALLLVSGVMALVGRQRVSDASPLMPEDAMATTKSDIDHVKARAGL